VPDLGLPPGTGAPVFVTAGFSAASGETLLGGSSVTVVLDSDVSARPAEPGAGACPPAVEARPRAPLTGLGCAP
jgi:hypothetical protein